MNRRNLLVGDQHVGVLQLGHGAVFVGGHVGAEVALVELHALNHVDIDAEGVGVLDGDDAVFADLFHRVGDLLANLRVARRDGADVFHLVKSLDLGRVLFHLFHQRVHGLVDAGANGQRVGTGSDVFQAFLDHDVGQKRRSRRAVACHVVGLDGCLADELGAHVLDLVFKLDLLGHRDAIVGDERRAVAALAGHVAALGA